MKEAAKDVEEVGEADEEESSDEAERVESNEDEGEVVEDLNVRCGKGADFRECNSGVFAVIQTVWEAEPKVKQWGVEVVKVTKVNEKDKTFEGQDYLCTVKQFEVACVDKLWHRASKGAKKAACDRVWNHYSVVLYFQNLNKHGGLPAKIKSELRRRKAELFGVVSSP